MKTSWIAALGIAAVALTSATALAEPWDHPHEQAGWEGPGVGRPASFERGYHHGYWEGEHARERELARIARWERYRRWEYMRRMRDHYRW